MDDVFQILADPTRRRILDTLRTGERSVGDIVDQVDIHQPGVSRHLKILHNAGLVDVRKDAQKRLYSIQPEPLRALDDWLADYRDLWARRLDRLEAFLEERKLEEADNDPE